MTKRQKPPQAMPADQAKQLVGQLTDIMHLIPDTYLERLVETLTAELRRRGMIRDGDEDDEMPF